LDKKICFICVAILVMILIYMWMPLSISKALGETYITVYIRPDGSVEPSNAPITTTDKHYYKLTGNLLGSIVIERSGVVIDGGGHALVGRVKQGFSNDMGLVVLASNVLITGFRIYNFSKALLIANTTSVEVSKCTVIDNWEGVRITSSNNVLIHNNTMKDNAPSIRLDNSTYVEARENVIEGKGAGVIIIRSSNAYIHENTIGSASVGIIVEKSEMVYIGGNRVVVPDDVGISVESSAMTIIFNNSLNGESGAGSCNINVRGSEKTVIHKNLLLNAPEAVIIDELTNHITISYNHLASEDPFRVPAITLTGNSTDVVVYGNSGKMRIEPHSSYEVVIENNTNVAIEGDTSSLLTICINMHTSIWLSNISNAYICGNLVDTTTVNGIVVSGTNIKIHGNMVKNYRHGIGISVSGDFIKVYENEVTNNSQGVAVSGSHFEIRSNNITYNNVGVVLVASSGVVHDNFIAFNGGGHEPFCSGPGTGVCIYGSEPYNITFYHNSFVNNSLNNGKQVYVTKEGYKWDNDYPSGGNYWSDYTGVDKKKGVRQDEPGSDGIGDTPYQVSRYPGELDRYPLVKRPPYPSKSLFTLSPPPNIVIEPPLIKISTPTPTPTSTTPTRTTYTSTSLPRTTTVSTIPITPPSQTHITTITITASTTPIPTSTPQTIASPTTVQGISGTVATTATTPQKVSEATTLIAVVVAVIVIGIAIFFISRKRMV